MKKSAKEQTIERRIPSLAEIRIITEAMVSVPDPRQESKIMYPIGEIVLLVVAALACGATDWQMIEMYGEENAEALEKYLGITRIPSHDTIERVMGIIDPAVLERIYLWWCGNMELEEVENLRGLKILNIDGKTMRGSKGRGQKALHVETAFDAATGVCLGQRTVEEKSNEITAIPALLQGLEIAGYIVTSDAMGTQTAIAKLIIDKGADYVLAVKGNQGTLYKELQEYAFDEELLAALKKAGKYKKTVEKAHGWVEKREFYQTGDIAWLSKKDDWEGLKTIGFEKKTLSKAGEKDIVSWRFFISSLEEDIDLFAICVRTHWRIESLHWLLDLITKEDANQTIERTAAQNLNIIRKWVVLILKNIECRKKRSLRLKYFMLSLNPLPALEMLARGFAGGPGKGLANANCET